MIYHDKNYAEHATAWRLVGAKFMSGVGDLGDWREWLSLPFDVVTTALPVGVDFTSISPSDGFGETDGPLDTLVKRAEKAQDAALPEKTAKAEEQRRESVGAPSVSDEIVATLRGGFEADPPPKPMSDKTFFNRPKAQTPDDEDVDADDK